MSIRDKQVINVLNYNDSIVVVSTRDNGYAVNPRDIDGGAPSILPLSFSEIEYINSNSNAFKSGYLRFPKEIEEEMYTELRIVGWEDILTNEEIEQILLHPTIEGLQKILSIKSSTVFERVRGIFTVLKNSGDGNISIRVDRIISERYKELVNKKTKTDISLVPKDVASIQSVSTEEVDSLKKQLQEMQAMMTKLLANQSASAGVEVNTDSLAESVNTKQAEDVVKKPAGRPPKSK